MSRSETFLVHPPAVSGEPAGAVSTPLYQTATFDVLASPGGGAWDYSRSGNPTRDVLETQLARLEGGGRSLCFTSGLAAIGAVLALLRPGDVVVTGRDLYGGTVRLLERARRRAGIGLRRVDTRDPEAVDRALQEGRAALVFLETPSNPRLEWTDVAAVARIARRHGVPLAVDNSMLSPYLYRPLDEGADLAIQSATKLLGGHSDLTAGVVSTRDGRLAEELAYGRNADGTALAPFPSWLLLRGMETLAVRLDRQLGNTRAVLALLAGHPLVRGLHYPGEGRGGTVVSFETGELELSRRLLSATRLFRATVSFGGVASSISLPCEMSHACLSPRDREAAELAPDLVRLSVGIEAAEDLVADLARALETS